MEVRRKRKVHASIKKGKTSKGENKWTGNTPLSKVLAKYDGGYSEGGASSPRKKLLSKAKSMKETHRFWGRRDDT